MRMIHPIAGAAALACAPWVCGQTLENAEVRIPYQELKQLLAKAAAPAVPKTPKPALLASKLTLSVDHGAPVIDASFRCTSFDANVSLIPLLAGDVTLGTQDPADARILMENDTFCLAMDRAGTTDLKVRLLAAATEEGFTLSLPECPSSMIEIAELPEGRAFHVTRGSTEETLTSRQSRPISNQNRELQIRLMDDRESHEALSAPEPSRWTWQQQTLVMPDTGDLLYQSLIRASALDGSGVEADLPLPADAQDVEVTGVDLVSQTKVRGDRRSLSLALRWRNRGVLDRQLLVSYRMPLRPLDRKWKLEAPGGDDTKTRFIIAASPLLAYAAEGLSGPLAAQGLPEPFAARLNGGSCHHLETQTTAELAITPIPVVPTADGVITRSDWSLKIEPDGAVLLTGNMRADHKGSVQLTFDTPPGMKLLSCEVAGKPVSPVDPGDGSLQLTLGANQEGTEVACSFTGNSEALDPVAGTMKFSLPKTPLFVHAIRWNLDLPAGYQAETHGNLQRSSPDGKSPPSRIFLSKNLCRDERPEIQIFYQRSDLNR